MKLVEKEILLERRRFAGRVFAMSASLILFVLAIAQGLLYFAGLRAASPGRSGGIVLLQHAWWWILAVSLLALLVAGWKGYRAWKDSARRVGRLMDEKLAASKNRLEASAELSRASDPLALAQRQETSDYLARNPARRRIYTFALATACCLALLILNGAVATKFIGLLQKSPALAQAKKPDLPKVPARKPYAKIDIVAPESETRATPIEEVVVKGDADSDNGFSGVSLEASINGGPDKSFPIDPGQFKKGGEIKFDQSLLLDELGAQPYDVVGYYLEGTSRHETPLKVSSQIQFIEVRPFREDIHKVPAYNGDSQCFAKLTWLISQEIIISKRTWVIASSPLPPDNPAVVAETGKSGDAQDKIATSTHELYQLMTAKGLPASIVDHVSQAETSMHQAVNEIKKPALLAANPIQRHALGELVEATKSFIKVMADNPAVGSNPNAVKDPFKDKQKLPNPSGPPATNPVVKLQKLIAREQDIVKDLSSSSSDENAPDDSANRAQSQTPKGASTTQNPAGQDQDKSSPPGSQQGAQQTAQGPSQGGQNSPTDGNQQGPPQTGPQMAQEQSRIGKELGDLQNEPDAPASSTPDMSDAQRAAQNSADKLAAEDREGALNDARTAEAAMLRAQAVMKAGAGQQMRDALAQAQQQLQDAAHAQLTASKPSDQAHVKDQADAARDNLVQEQDHQAASGDPKLARLADGLVKQYDQSGIPQKLAQLGTQPSSTPDERAAAAEAMRKFADQLSAERLATQSEIQNLKDILKRIDRIQQNMNAAHGTAEEQAQLAHELQSDLNLALSDADVLLPPSDQPGPTAGKAVDETGGHPGHADDADHVGNTALIGLTASGGVDYRHIRVPMRPVSPTDFQALSGPMAAFHQEIEQRIEYLHSQTVLTYLNPDESPEEYRAQVAAYYERISRETKAATPKPPAEAPSP